MAGTDFRAAREARGWTQQDLARRLGVSQTLVSLWEHGTRAVPVRRVAQLRKLGVQLPPVALPLRGEPAPAKVDYARELANLGYPGLAHYKTGSPKWNPARLLVLALAEDQLDRRLAEALPWLVFRFPDMDWEWVCREAKLRDLQNRLGFTLSLAQALAARWQSPEAAQRLAQVAQELRRSRLAREDSYCNEHMTESERRWLRRRRPQSAAAWNLLSDLRPEHLTHAG